MVEPSNLEEVLRGDGRATNVAGAAFSWIVSRRHPRPAATENQLPTREARRLATDPTFSTGGVFPDFAYGDGLVSFTEYAYTTSPLLPHGLQW